jgi:hypothetical protein
MREQKREKRPTNFSPKNRRKNHFEEALFVRTKHHNISGSSRQFPKFSQKQFPNPSRQLFLGTIKSSRTRLEFRELEKIMKFPLKDKFETRKRKPERKKELSY